MLKKPLIFALCFSLAFPVNVVLAAPSGGTVVRGQADIKQSGATTTIKQSSNRAIVNWKNFDIAKNESVRHSMPSSNSAALHRVTGGGGASQLAGELKSNGNIFLVNPAGVVIHKGARIDTGGFMATTHDIANEEFMKGNYAFTKPGLPSAAVINQGHITVRDQGFAALVAPTVRNEGVIAARLGKVALASGDAFKLDMYGDDLINFTVPENMVDGLHRTDGTPLGVDNSGAIKAEGGVVLLSAAQLDGVVSSVVNNSGVVNASSAELRGGRIVFGGEGEKVDVQNTGTVTASSDTAEGGVIHMVADVGVKVSGTVEAKGASKGGEVVLTGKEVALTGKTLVDASGAQGGGTVLVGGNALDKEPERNALTTSVGQDVLIAANAVSSGDGGQVGIWSDGKTTFDGAISARGGALGGNGGQVETSGSALKVGDSARVDTSATAGHFGDWLLDPVDFIIAASGGDMTGATLSANLGSGNVTILSSNGQSGVNGDIFVNDKVTWANHATLTLNAYRNVNINADLTATGATAGLVILPGTGGAGEYSLAMGNKITLSGINPSLTIAGRQYTVINSLDALQNMNQNLTGNYALGSDIDATATSSWNGGKGFAPVGNDGTEFSGHFDGLGYSITGLTINNPDTQYVGFFGKTSNSSRISNVGLKDILITDAGKTDRGQYICVGSLVGWAEGAAISNSHSTGTLAVTNSGTTTQIIIGGLVGHSLESTISYSYSKASVSVAGSGHLVAIGGFSGSAMVGTISNSYSTGNVTDNSIFGVKIIGGFVGANNATISNSYTSSPVTTTNSYDNTYIAIGGFAGDNAIDISAGGNIISNSYSTGKVTVIDNGGVSPHIGGFLGQSLHGSQLSNSYWDIESSGLTTSDGGIGLTTAQMKSKASFNGWNFTDTWTIAEGQSYPQLRNAVSKPNTEPGTNPGDTANPITPNTPSKEEMKKLQEAIRDLEKNFPAIAKELQDLSTGDRTMFGNYKVAEDTYRDALAYFEHLQEYIPAYEQQQKINNDYKAYVLQQESQLQHNIAQLDDKTIAEQFATESINGFVELLKSADSLTGWASTLTSAAESLRMQELVNEADIYELMIDLVTPEALQTAADQLDLPNLSDKEKSGLIVQALANLAVILKDSGKTGDTLLSFATGLLTDKAIENIGVLAKIAASVYLKNVQRTQMEFANMAASDTLKHKTMFVPIFEKIGYTDIDDVVAQPGSLTNVSYSVMLLAVEEIQTKFSYFYDANTSVEVIKKGEQSIYASRMCKKLLERWMYDNLSYDEGKNYTTAELNNLVQLMMPRQIGTLANN